MVIHILCLITPITNNKIVIKDEDKKYGTIAYCLADVKAD